MPAAASLREESVLMQDLCSSHSEVALSWAEMMALTQAAGLSPLQGLEGLRVVKRTLCGRK